MNTHGRFSQILRRERKLRGWSQEELAAKVGVDVKTVRRWEQGVSLPHPYAKQALSRVLEKSIPELGLADSNAIDTALPVDDKQEIEPETPRAAEPYVDPLLSTEDVFSTALQEDWSEVPYVGNVYGRQAERAQVLRWLEEDSCRVISIVGMGGVGKTTLAALIATHTKDLYPCFWHSLHNMPSMEQILRECIRFLSRQQQGKLPDTEDELIVLLLHYLRHRRCLLIFDNFESILQPQQRAGLYRKGYEGYGRLIQRLATAHHRSCLLLTSRDKPAEIAQLEGHRSPVHTLSLQGVTVSEGQGILHEKELSGSEEEWGKLIHLYAGNPLALKIIAEPICEIFDGSLAKFLVDGTFAFGDLSDVLEKQFARLSTQERDLLTWLAIEREEVPLDVLHEDLLQKASKNELVEALTSLSRRSLLETRKSTSFTLQPVIMEHVTTRLVKRFVEEFEEEENEVWTNYALLNAQSKNYVRESQVRVLLEPVAQRLLDSYGREELKHYFQQQLATQRQRHPLQKSYQASNILHILTFLGYTLHDFDFSHLMMRRPYLQNVDLPGVNFISAQFVTPVFTNTFGNILSVAFNSASPLLAVGTATGDIWVYDTQRERQHSLYTGHTDGVWSVAFSPDQQLLASSSDDETIRLWKLETDECIAVLHDHHQRVRAITFDGEGKMLVSGSDDGTIRLWNVQTGECINVLHGHTDRVWAVALYSSEILATGSTDHTIRLWDLATGKCMATLHGHTNSIRSLSFHPDGKLLASGSDDETIRLWDVANASEAKVLQGHANRVWSVAFSQHGSWLASGSEDTTVRIWDTKTGRCFQTLQAHTHGVRSVAFNKDDVLASGGDDQAVRLWDVRTGHSIRTFQGYTHRIWSVLFHPDRQHLLSSSEDQTIRLWNIHSGTCLRTIEERRHAALCIAVSPDGSRCASGGEDETVRLWDLAAGREQQVLRGHSDWVRAVAFHPDGYVLASGSEDATVRIWDIHSSLCLYTLKGHTSWVRDLSFNADGSILASSGDDTTIRLWDPISGSPIAMLAGHTGRIRSVAFHPEGPLLLSGGEDHTIRLWDSTNSQCIATLAGHSGRIRCVTFSPDGRTFISSGEDNTICLWNTDDTRCWLTLHSPTKARRVSFHPSGELLASSGDDGSIRLWELPTGRLIQTLTSERPYEGMNITHVQGLTEAQKETLRLLGAIEST